MQDTQPSEREGILLNAFIQGRAVCSWPLGGIGSGQGRGIGGPVSAIHVGQLPEVHVVGLGKLRVQD